MSQKTRPFAKALLPFIAAAGLGSLASQASAADTNWAGTYFGGNLGLVLEADSGKSRSIHLGHDWQTGRLVYGAELGYGQSDIGTPEGPIEDFYRVKLRTGYAKDRVLYYAVVGASQVQGRFGSELGAVYGGGVAYDVGNSLTVGGELLHQEFSDFNGTGDSLGINTLTVRVSYRF